MKFKEYYNEAQQIALPGMRLPDEREQIINIFINRFIEGLKDFYPDKDAMITAVKDALEESKVEFDRERDQHLVINLVNRRMR